MTPDATRELRVQLGATPPKGLEALSDDEAHDLAAALRDARTRQSTALQQAMRDALNHVPRLLRGPVRRLVAG
jgi:hypothetical protein